MHDNGSLTRRRYDRIAPLFDAMERPMEMTSFAGWRKELLSSLAGRVLEVGIGTGKNLRYYPVNIELTGIDISPAMLTRARRKASALKLQTDLRLMDVERMTFPDRSFDYVVSTCVFCSVPDPLRGLREIKRVLTDDGTALFLEHVRSENTLLGKLMDLLNPLVHKAIGPNINRRTVENIETAGLTIVHTENAGLSIIKKIRAVSGSSIEQL